MKRWTALGTLGALTLGATIYWSTEHGSSAALTRESNAATHSIELSSVDEEDARALAATLPATVESGPRAPQPATKNTRAGLQAEKGKGLFEGAPLVAKALPAAGSAERARDDSGAQARTLNPRLERRLARLKEKLRTAPESERQSIKVEIQTLERNLEARRQRAAGAASSSPLRPTPP